MSHERFGAVAMAEYEEREQKIKELEKQGKIFVIRPSKLIEISRLEKDSVKMQSIYNLGLQDFNDNYIALQKYLKK